MPPLRNAGEWHPWHFIVKIGNTCRAKLTSFCCAGKSASCARTAASRKETNRAFRGRFIRTPLCKVSLRT